MIDKRLMYAQGRRVGFEPGGMAGEHGMGAGVGADGKTDGQRDGGSGSGHKGPAELGVTTRGQTTTSFTSDDDNRQNYRTDTYTSPPKDLDETTIDEITTTFAPKDNPFSWGNIFDGIKTIGTTAVKGLIATQTFGALGLSPKAVAIGNTALGFTNDIGLTKSASISELGMNTLGSVGDVFSGNTNKGSTGMNTNSFSGNTNNSLSDNNQNNGGEGGNNDVLSSEYILLLQKMQLGNFTQEDQTRFNLLKTMLGK